MSSIVLPSSILIYQATQILPPDSLFDHLLYKEGIKDHISAVDPYLCTPNTRSFVNQYYESPVVQWSFGHLNDIYQGNIYVMEQSSGEICTVMPIWDNTVSDRLNQSKSRNPTRGIHTMVF
ncbi:hypothetical protein llap_4379 [Limosa lapponica baueri]|uniref:Uncharacterized protein n=1 Tax=Limosa lapponica baueri TaxID=1758121 RepID=A0A2I0UGY1_LIMLA|nr:hypothetical protein llap_4379 [Limosa lapponica baueri]